MARDDLKLQQSMNGALDHELSEHELAALHAQLEESSEAAAHWERLRKTDELMRTTPLVAPSAGFTRRVMAAIAAIPLPEFARRQPGIGVALGLAVAAFMTVPIFSVLFFVLFSVLTDPGALNVVLQAIMDGASYTIGLVANIAGDLESAATDTPVLLVLLTTMIPVTALWVWLVRYLLKGSRMRSRP
jgi:anti-sigma factor RsiW